MPKLHYTLEIKLPLHKAFKLGSNLKNLPKIQPGFVKIIYGKTPHRLGSKMAFFFLNNLIPSFYLGKIVEYKKNSHFTDEQILGPFRKWKHCHRFVSQGKNKTKLVDEIDYEFWDIPFGKWIDSYLVKPQVEKMFLGRQKNILTYLKQLEIGAS